MNISIRTKGLDLTDELKDFTEKKIQSLEKFFKKVMETHVVLERTTNHHKQGKVFKASVEMHVPGDKLFAEENAESIEAAVNMLKDHLQREIKHYKGMMQAKKRQMQKTVREMKGAEAM